MDTFWHLEKEDFFKGIDEARSAFLKNAQRLELPNAVSSSKCNTQSLGIGVF